MTRIIGWVIVCTLAGLGQAQAARVSDVSNTVHNLSTSWGGAVTDTRGVKAVSEDRICVFCHTPHASNSVAQTPLWNRKLEGVGDDSYTATYTMYDSASMDASVLSGGAPTAPANSSKLCLSCHDGVVAVGTVNVLNGSPADISMTGTGAGGTMPWGNYGDTGSTARIGVDLSNDHPISIAYDTDLVNADGELNDPLSSPHIGIRGIDTAPLIPLIPDPNDGNIPKLECVSCHDPHIRDDSEADIKFLRLNRFQAVQGPSTVSAGSVSVDFNENNDIICLACHNKQGWADSAHANSHFDVANETYNNDAADARDFPRGIKVWQAACLNCHDTHTVAGSRRLLREGTDSVPSSSVLKPSGGKSAIEETCYQCHSPSGYAYNVLDAVADGAAYKVPNIKTDFERFYHMPISSADQLGAAETHNIGDLSGPLSGQTQAGKDFLEGSNTMSGTGAASNRHVECTDCHNPHRVTKNRSAFSNPATPDAAGTHNHGYGHTNLISGVLRGSWGVEPNYPVTADFYDTNITYDIKRGIAPPSAPTDVGQSYVTREYQVCMRCHSSFYFAEDPNKLWGEVPLGAKGGATPKFTNGMEFYTNQAREFQADPDHKGLTGSPGDSGAYNGSVIGTTELRGSYNYTVDFTTNNRRGWHPVMDGTGRQASRDVAGRSVAPSFLPPWDGTSLLTGLGGQTMYCSDCHGSAVTSNTSVVPNGGEDGEPWGPHGSSKPFILKGDWTSATGTGQQDDLCFKCHRYEAYAQRGASHVDPTYPSGFSGTGYNSYPNLHQVHADRLGKMRCTWCHVAVPHGWKNKALLVNLNDVGPEALCRAEDRIDDVNCVEGSPMPRGTQVRNGPLPNDNKTPWDPNGLLWYWNQSGGAARGYTNPPYYLEAVNKVINFKQSGQWRAADCGSSGEPGSGQIGMCGGSQWATQAEGCTNFP